MVEQQNKTAVISPYNKDGLRDCLKATDNGGGATLLSELFPGWDGGYFSGEAGESSYLTFETLKDGECGDNPDEKYVWLYPLHIVQALKRAKADQDNGYGDPDAFREAYDNQILNTAEVVISRGKGWEFGLRGEDAFKYYFSCRVTLPISKYNHPNRAHYSELRYSRAFDMRIETTRGQYHKFPHREIAARVLNNALRVIPEVKEQ